MSASHGMSEGGMAIIRGVVWWRCAGGDGCCGDGVVAMRRAEGFTGEGVSVDAPVSCFRIAIWVGERSVKSDGGAEVVSPLDWRDDNDDDDDDDDAPDGPPAVAVRGNPAVPLPGVPSNDTPCIPPNRG